MRTPVPDLVKTFACVEETTLPLMTVSALPPTVKVEVVELLAFQTLPLMVTVPLVLLVSVMPR